MHLKATLLGWLKVIVADIRKSIIGIIVAGLIVAAGGLHLLSKTVLNFSTQLLSTPTPLWATILLILLCCLYTCLKLRQHQKSYKPPNLQEELREEFGVYWNNQYKLRCLKCKWPLKCASKKHDPSIFFCSNCDTKHALRDKNGNHLTEAQAIEELKKLPTSQ
jgi:hypothetical protein